MTPTPTLKQFLSTCDGFIKKANQARMNRNPNKNAGEWGHSINIQRGCRNNCTYGYCQKMAKRFPKSLWPKSGKWDVPDIKWSEVFKKEQYYAKTNGVCFFATMHDLDDQNLFAYIIKIHNLLLKGNYVLLVSKPRVKYIREIMAFLEEDWPSDRFTRFEFRFTIGSFYPHTLFHWEPDAPILGERLQCMADTLYSKYQVSVSCEPLLDEDCRIVTILLEWRDLLEIWIGPMQYVKDAPVLEYKKIYDRFKGEPKIRWKHDFRKHLPLIFPEDCLPKQKKKKVSPGAV
jgi:hypothetical protein